VRQFTKRLANRVFRATYRPADVFQSYEYQRHNQRRQEHLASLGLPIAGERVLEVGAGIGDQTSFFLDRGCEVVSTEPRKDNLAVLRSRYPDLRVERLDLDAPDRLQGETFDIVYCYGTLYHLKTPAEAIKFMAERCSKMLLMETCVSVGSGEAINLCEERAEDQSQSIHGQGCRPTRKWVYNALKEHFPHVYMPQTQPWHKEFPLDWTTATSARLLTRSVFIASRVKLALPVLVEGIPEKQKRH